MSKIVLKNLSKIFGDVKAVDCLNLEINEREFVTFLGPSGCGKTTTLRCLSGLEEPDGGEIYIDDKCIFSIEKNIFTHPGRRGLGLVFQNYALWPHMKVGQNIAFGLRQMSSQKDLVQQKVGDILKTVGLSDYQDRYPHELSGGQQQRVALARMIVNKPDIFLFDEPLSNLDAKLRMKLRSELKHLHLDLGATTVYVTHDQVEALALSDKIVIMKDGIIQQVGTPYEVYHFPANLFVADFMGNPQTNLLKASGNCTNGKCGISFQDCPELNIDLDSNSEIVQGQELVVNIRPEDFAIHKEKDSPGLPCLIYTTQPMGSEILVHLKSKIDEIDIMVKGLEEDCLDLKADMTVFVMPKRGNIYDSKSGRNIFSFGLTLEKKLQ